jgi:hypothetical protein
VIVTGVPDRLPVARRAAAVSDTQQVSIENPGRQIARWSRLYEGGGRRLMLMILTSRMIVSRDGELTDVSAWGFQSLADMTIVDTGVDTRIEVDAANSVTLVDFGDPAALQAADFIFA